MAKSDVNFDFDLLAEIADQAPLAGGIDFNQTLFGRVYADNFQAVHYDKGFVKRDYEFGTPLKEGENIDFRLHVECEKKDGTTYEKLYFVSMKKSGKNKSPWAERIVPSIVKTFGIGNPSKDKDAEMKRIKKAVSTFFAAVHGDGTYMEIEDFKIGGFREDKNGKTDDSGEVIKYPITVPVIKKSFKNKAECDKARNARFAKDALPDGAVPLGVINTFKATVESLGGLEETLSQFPDEFEGYPVNDVVRESGLS